MFVRSHGFFIVFFFKQKTAYEMRISDWSSDVCSSDLSDAGLRVVAPFLRAHGHRRLDGLVVSHADLDHAGGLGSVLAAVPVQQAYASFDLAALLRRQTDTASRVALRHLPSSVPHCQAGMAWQVAGVALRFLPPAPAARPPRPQGNAPRCAPFPPGRPPAGPVA